MSLSTLLKNSIGGGVALIGLSLLAPVSSVSAATFSFSFSNVEGLVSGTVSGLIELSDSALTMDAVYPATSITITSAPAALGYTLPITNTTLLTSSNEFTVVGGNIVNAVFAVGSFETGIPSAFGFNVPTVGTIFNLRGVTNPLNQGVLDANSSTLEFAPVSTPEPGAILGLLAVGALGAVSRKRKV